MGINLKEGMSGLHRKNIPVSIQRRITKFYVSNIPERCRGNDLAGFVREFGMIYDIYIARKKDKEGNSFGFVSMLDIKDKEETCNRLSGIRMGEYRLSFNVARYVLEEGEIDVDKATEWRKRKDGIPDVGEGKNEGLQQRKETSFSLGGKSFKEMLLGNKKESSGVRSVMINSSVKAFEIMLGKALIVRMVDLVALRNIKSIMKENGMSEGRIQYLGGVSVMISYEDSVSAVKALDAGRQDVRNFSQISLWEGQSVGYERLAWLKVQGIPLQILTNVVIDMVGGMFGKLVQKAERSEMDVDLSFEFVAVLVGEGRRIAEEIDVFWNDRKFRVWVMEEMGDWVPEFIEPWSSGEEGVNAGDVSGLNNFNTGDVSGLNKFNGNSDETCNGEGLQEDRVKEIFQDNQNFNVGVVNAKKKKKYKKRRRSGLSSKSISPSFERPNNGKRPRNSPDLFGLNPFIYQSEPNVTEEVRSNRREEAGREVVRETVQEVEGHAEEVDVCGGTFDLNSFPSAGSSMVRSGRGSEIEATIEMGKMLGIDLASFENLIAEAIHQEGLERSKS